MKVKNLFLLFLVGMFCSYVANAALDSTAEGCSKTWIYCGTYSFYTDAETGKQFTVFVSEDGEFIEKWDGHVRLSVSGSAVGTALHFISKTQLGLFSSFVGTAFALDEDGVVVDSIKIKGDGTGRIIEFDMPFDAINIVDNNGNTFWTPTNFKKNTPPVNIPELLPIPVYQYIDICQYYTDQYFDFTTDILRQANFSDLADALTDYMNNGYTMQEDELSGILEIVQYLPAYQDMLNNLRAKGLDVDQILAEVATCITSSENVALKNTIHSIANINSDIVNIYPNPATNDINVKLNGKYENISAEIFDIAGNSMFTSQYSNSDMFSVDVRKLNLNGTYIIQLTLDGEKYITNFIVNK